MKEPTAATPGVAHMQSLEIVRRHELEIARKYFPPVTHGKRCDVLELGAGTGLQARYLSDLGYDVVAIDLPGSRYRDARVFNIIEYDGIHIPATDGQFDLVFSSNVLEHVVHIDEILRETCRVLKPGGTAVHILPSSSCRLWSIPSHYAWLARRIFARLVVVQGQHSAKAVPRTPSTYTEWLGTFFPMRHGERGNTITEAFYFSQHYWMEKFIKHRFKLERVVPNGVFYTISNAFGTSLRMDARRRVAGILGSSCFIYVMSKEY